MAWAICNRLTGSGNFQSPPKPKGPAAAGPHFLVGRNADPLANAFGARSRTLSELSRNEFTVQPLASQTLAVSWARSQGLLISFRICVNLRNLRITISLIASPPSYFPSVACPLTSHSCFSINLKVFTTNRRE